MAIGAISKLFLESENLTDPFYLLGKKVKRTGEASLFHEQTGKLTEEAFQACKVIGVEPRELYPK